MAPLDVTRRRGRVTTTWHAALLLLLLGVVARCVCVPAEYEADTHIVLSITRVVKARRGQVVSSCTWTPPPPPPRVP